MTKKTIQKLIIFSVISLILGGVVLISRNVRANNVCSYNASEEIGITDFYYNNIPVNPEKCSLCVGNMSGGCEDLNKEECENSYHTNPYYLPGMMDFFLNQAKEEDIYNDRYAFQCVWNDFDYPVSPYGYIWSGSRKVYFPEPGCLSYQFEYVETLDRPRDKLYYNYQPCNPPPSCQDKCQQDYQRDGACLEKAGGDYPEALKQDGQYRECGSGESCYCNNHKPEVKELSLELNERHRQHLDKIFSMPEQDIISEYDVEHLICRANIYDEDIEDQEWIEKHRPNFEILYGWTLNDTFKRLTIIGKPMIKCKKNEQDTVTCETSAYYAKTNVKRGMLLKCRVTPQDPYQKGEPKESNIKAVADHLYYFFRTQLSWGIAYGQYLVFLDKSAVTNNFWDIKDRTQRIGKSYFYRNPASLKIRHIKFLFIKGSFFNFREVAKKAGANWDKGEDDKLTFLSDASIEKYNECFQDQLQGAKAVGFAKFKSDLIVLSPLSSRTHDFTHEMGHASIWSGLCDEYGRRFWDMQNKRYSCLNPFPNCCNKNNDCDIPEWCEGMPYHPNQDSPQPNYNRHESIYEPNFRSVMGHGTIYPIEARCPLRNCQ